MFSNKKAFQSHLYVIFVVGIVMTFLFVTIFGFVFKVDPVNCTYYDFDIKSKCKDNKNVKFSLSSQKSTYFYFNDDNDEQYVLEAGSTKNFNFRADGNKIKIIPYYMINGEEYVCNGKAQSIDVSSLLKC